MNERIKLLALQAGLDMWINGNDEVELSENQKKFAELIVRECVKVVNDLGSDVLFEHFGVE